MGTLRQATIAAAGQRPLGLIGGMSWESTLVYYRLLNQGIAARLGGLHSADLRIESVDFGPVAAAQAAGEWDLLGERLGASAARLRAAGAHGLLLATNTMHLVADAVRAAAAPLPLLHIGDAVGQALRAAGHRRVGLLGTRFTMERRFLAEHLRLRHGLEVSVPAPPDRDAVHAVIYDELCRGQVRDASREVYLAVIERLAAAGCEAVVLGCTEIEMLVDPVRDRARLAIPAFDSTALHAAAAVDWMLGADTTDPTGGTPP